MKITICGSMFHEPSMAAAAATLRELGYEVDKPNVVEGHVYADNLDANAELKRGFIDEHFRKIDTSDAILVINEAKNGIDNYIGGNTLIEIAYAYAHGLDIFLLNPVPEVSYADEIRGMNPVILDGDVAKVAAYFAGLPKAYISSESPVKHLAVSRAFRRAGVSVQTVAVPMPSGVNEQPRSIDETYEGAINRHTQLVETCNPTAEDYMVTIESGIFTPRSEHNYFGTTTLVAEKNGERHVGIDTDIEFPKHMTDRVPSEFKDLGELVKTEYGAATSDPFPYFTGGKLTRTKVLESALYNVLIQFAAGEELTAHEVDHPTARLAQ